MKQVDKVTEGILTYKSLKCGKLLTIHGDAVPSSSYSFPFSFILSERFRLSCKHVMVPVIISLAVGLLDYRIRMEALPEERNVLPRSICRDLTTINHALVTTLYGHLH